MTATRFLSAAVFTLVIPLASPASDPGRVLPAGKQPADYRLGKPKDLDGYFPMRVPANLQEWQARRRQLREQLLVATGLWPMPERPALHPVIHGKIDRDDYTIEKVFFASYPGHYVSGNLYRPKGGSAKHPGVLCPHGHWADGRLYDAGEKEAQAQIKMGAEKTMAGARYPLQARCAMLARMGCVVFMYDMVGVADSQPIPHREGFKDAEAELHLQSFMGLQTYNSIRALDFLCGLPDVDRERIGVTGASGGGTQTFILCGIDDRPAAAFPAVMVSTAMQGGCVCENCSYLRQGAGNIDIAGLFAPKPLGMTGAHDWTIDIQTKGLPELRKLYHLYGAEDRVMARCFSQFPHNYNQVSREVMYNWFNKFLELHQPTPVAEKPFVPVPPRELSVYDAAHPRPGDAVGARELRRTLTRLAEEQLNEVRPADQSRQYAFEQTIGTALRVMIGEPEPLVAPVTAERVASEQRSRYRLEKFVLASTKGEQLPAVRLTPEGGITGGVVVWVHPDGKSSLWQADGRLAPQAQRILDTKRAIVAGDVLGTGELSAARPPKVDAVYAGFTFGYNRPLLANRVHDVLTLVQFARGPHHDKVDMIGWGRAGVWVVLARALAGSAVQRTAADLHGFSFQQVHSSNDEAMLPGALKYGDVTALAALCAPAEMFLTGVPSTSTRAWLANAYRATGHPERLHQSSTDEKPAAMLNWLLK